MRMIVIEPARTYRKGRAKTHGKISVEDRGGVSGGATDVYATPPRQALIDLRNKYEDRPKLYGLYMEDCPIPVSDSVTTEWVDEWMEWSEARSIHRGYETAEGGILWSLSSGVLVAAVAAMTLAAVAVVASQLW